MGAGEASARIGSTEYSVADDVSWMDTSGSLHDGGWPACMSKVGSTVEARFGEVPVSGLDSDTRWDVIVWVDCRGAVRIS